MTTKKGAAHHSTDGKKDGKGKSDVDVIPVTVDDIRKKWKDVTDFETDGKVVLTDDVGDANTFIQIRACDIEQSQLRSGLIKEDEVCLTDYAEMRKSLPAFGGGRQVGRSKL